MQHRNLPTPRRFQVLMIAAACVILASCGGGRFAKHDTPTAKPAAEAQQPERRRGRLKFFRPRAEAPAPATPAQPALAEPNPASPAPETGRARVEPKVAKPKGEGAGQLVAAAPDETRRRVAAYLKAKGYSLQQEDQT